MASAQARDSRTTELAATPYNEGGPCYKSNPSPPQEHALRIKDELRQAGVTRYGMMKFAVKQLPKIIHHGEHIKGAVYGRHGVGSTFAFEEGMLVATDHRMLFIDCEPLFLNLAELTYDVVSGVRQMSNGIFSSMTLHTRIGDFPLRFVNARCAEHFVHYIEQRRLESGESLVGIPPFMPANMQLAAPIQFTDDTTAHEFLRTHDTAVLSTVDRDGETHGTTVHYLMGESNDLFVLSKADTSKVHNLLAHPRIALTVYDAEALQTVQIDALAHIEADRRIKEWVWQTVAHPRPYGGQLHLPPVTALHNGAFITLRITPISLHFSDFN